MADVLLRNQIRATATRVITDARATVSVAAHQRAAEIADMLDVEDGAHRNASVAPTRNDVRHWERLQSDYLDEIRAESGHLDGLLTIAPR